MYVYESHLGGGYFGSETPLSFEECYCEQCGDSDWEVGEFETAEQFVAYIADDICFEPGRGGWDDGYNNGYQDGHDDGYEEGYGFATSHQNNEQGESHE